MTRRSPAETPTRRLRGSAELVQAVPYLLGFHPHRSLVLVGLRDGLLVVTARLDLADVTAGARPSPVLRSTLGSMCAGGTTELVAAVYPDPEPDPDPQPAAERGSVADVVDDIEDAAAGAGCLLLDVLLVREGRWWSLSCRDPACCPDEGSEVPQAPSAFAAAATVEGVVPLPDRESLAGLLTPLPDSARGALEPLLAEAENEACAAVLAGRGERHARSVKRAVFAAARASAEPGWRGPADAIVAAFGAALLSTALRDAVWIAIDDGRLDGRDLWRELARRLPEPYDAGALFLYGWAAWRSGNTALAGIAVRRALDSDPTYSAADLLQAALTRGLDPRRVPRLRRSA